MDSNQSHRITSICDPVFRDPMTHVYSFVGYPGNLRAACHFMVECFSYSCDLGFPRHCPYLIEGRQRGENNPMSAEVPEASTETLRMIPVRWNFVEEIPAPPPSRTKTWWGYELCAVDLVGAASPDYSVSGYNASECGTKGASIGINRLTMRSGTLNSIQEKFFVCSNLSELTLVDLPELTSIAHFFLCESQQLKKATISRLPKLHTIGNHFVKRCYKLIDFTFSELPELTEIGNLFLLRCYALIDFTLSGLPKLTSIGKQFMDGCNELRNVTLRDLPSLECLNDHAHLHCDKLQSFSLINLPELHLVGTSFLEGCQEVRTIRLKGLPKLERIRVQGRNVSEIEVEVEDCNKNLIVA